MKKTVRIFASIFTFIALTFILAACGNSTPKADYSESKAEKVLNDGGEIKGKTVSIKVAKLEPKSAFGYNIEAGQHLNFVSEENPDVKVGDNLIVKVKKVKSVLGSFVINYNLIHKTAGKKVATVKKSSSSKIKKSSSVKPDPNASKRAWTYKDDIFDAGIETYKFTKAEIRDSASDGKKVLALYCDVTNNSTKEQDPSNIYMVVHAFQKTNTANKQLDPGTNALNENADDPLQEYNDALSDKLLPGKTTRAVMLFELVNDADVTVEFENADFDKIGSKTYKISDLKYVKSNNSSVLNGDVATDTDLKNTSSSIGSNSRADDQSQAVLSETPKKINGAGPDTTDSSEPKDTDMVSVGAGRYSQYNDPHSQTETPKEERALEEYVNSLNNQ